MTPLSDEQKRDAVLIVSVGCDRETAARFAGCSLEQLNTALHEGTEFAAELQRAEAGCELAHMRAIQQAARDERHWRASVWWLERRLPERYARRDVDAVGRRELGRFLAEVARRVALVVPDESGRQRILDSIGTLDEPLSARAKADDEAGGDPFREAA